MIFNQVQTEKLKNSAYASQFEALENQYKANFESGKLAYQDMLGAIESEETDRVDLIQGQIRAIKTEQNEIRDEVKALIVENDPAAETRDTDYVFMRFVMDYLPKGL